MLLKCSKVFLQYFLAAVLVTNFLGCAKKRKLTELDLLVISNVLVTNITTSGATITWDTNKPATTQVLYGKTTDYGSLTPEDANKAINHSMTLSGLDLGALYHFKVKSVDDQGNNIVSEDYNFTTAPDTTAPVISTVAVSNVSSAGATITWMTDEPATSQVIYGKTSAYGSQTTEDTGKTTSHSVTLGALDAGSVYYYKVKSSDAAGNVATGGDNSFTVLIISNVTPGSITATSAVISWSTDKASTSQVYYDTSTAYGINTVEDTNLVTNHTVTLTGLHAGTLYYFKVKSAAASDIPTFGIAATMTTDTTVYLYFDDIEYTDGNNTVKIYDDNVLIGSASGYMGANDGSLGLAVNLAYATSPNNGVSCLRATYDTTQENWVGLYIKTGAGIDWFTTTNALAGLDIATNKLTFYARADSEVTVQELGMGVIRGSGSDASGQNKLSDQVLKTTWQKFTVDLTNKNVSNQIGLFYFKIIKP